MNLDYLIEYSVRKMISHESRKHKRRRVFASIARILSLKRRTDMRYTSLWNCDELMYNIKKSMVSKGFSSDITDRRCQRRNAFSESCNIERKLLMRIIFELLRESHIQNFFNS